MIHFGRRKVVKQGGSCLISLPMAWVKGLEFDLKEVKIEQNADNTLRIAPAMPCKDVAGTASDPLVMEVPP